MCGDTADDVTSQPPLQPGAGVSFVPTRVTVAFEDGTVTLLPRRAPVGNSAPIRGVSLAAFPLMGVTLADVAGQIAAILGRPTHHVPAMLSAGQVDSQPGIVILGLTATEAEHVGATVGLKSVFFWDGRRAGILACSPDS